MNICFLDNTFFTYNSKDINSFKLRGAETVLINMATSLAKFGHHITVINNCPQNENINGISWININHLTDKLSFDLAISNNDCRHFDKINAKIYLDDLSNSGDVILFNALIPHGVDIIDENENEDWLSFEGRMMMIFAINKVVDNENIGESIDLS